MDFTYKKAGLNDLDILIKTRIDILRVINHIDADTDMGEFEKKVKDYYKTALKDGP